MFLGGERVCGKCYCKPLRMFVLDCINGLGIGIGVGEAGWLLL